MEVVQLASVKTSTADSRWWKGEGMMEWVHVQGFHALVLEVPTSRGLQLPGRGPLSYRSSGGIGLQRFREFRGLGSRG